VIVFVAAALIAVRNLPVAAIVLAPCLGRALKRPETSASRTTERHADPPSRVRLQRMATAVLVAAFVLFGAAVMFGPERDALALDAYPQAAVTYLKSNALLGAPHRLAHEDFVGNYLTFRYSNKAHDFIDDRYDMFPLAVSNDYLALLGGRPDALAVLDRRKVDVVLWERNKPLATILANDPHWRQIYSKDNWVIYQRVPPPPA
ncbi:MAG: hypothetical protein M3159_08770, partial [Actinomycetota bacterium]|nr:hypothetical protein [Actinomycetota bacterium]